MRLGIRLLAMIGAVLVGGGVLAGTARDEAVPPTVTRTEGLPPPTTDEFRVSYATDVFVGRVLAQAHDIAVLEPKPPFPPEAPQSRPSTVYAVEVLRPIMGAATGVVLVRQLDTYDRLATPSGDGPPLLAPGETAVFVAIWEDRYGWRTLTEGRYGHTRVPSDWEQAPAVARFEALVAAAAPATPTGGANPPTPAS